MRTVSSQLSRIRGTLGSEQRIETPSPRRLPNAGPHLLAVPARVGEDCSDQRPRPGEDDRWQDLSMGAQRLQPVLTYLPGSREREESDVMVFGETFEEVQYPKLASGIGRLGKPRREEEEIHNLSNPT